MYILKIRTSKKFEDYTEEVYFGNSLEKLNKKGFMLMQKSSKWQYYCIRELEENIDILNVNMCKKIKGVERQQIIHEINFKIIDNYFINHVKSKTFIDIPYRKVDFWNKEVKDFYRIQKKKDRFFIQNFRNKRETSHVTCDINHCNNYTIKNLIRDLKMVKNN